MNISFFLSRKSLRCLVVSGLLVGLGANTTWGQNSKPSCGPSPEIEKALQQVTALEDEEPMIGFDLVREKKLKLLGELLKKYPNDVFMNERYQDIKGLGLRLDEAMSAEYRARLEKSPNDPVAQYLYARTLVGRQTKEAVSLLERAAQLPQAHLFLLILYGGNSSFSDPAKLQAHLQNFRATCPESLEYHSRLFPATNKELLNTATTMFRAQIKERRDAEALAAYARLWLMERNNLAPAEARQLQEDDLKRLRALNLTTEKDWFGALLAGYRQTNDAEGLRWAYEQLERQFPKSLFTLRRLDARLHAENRLPPGAATPEAIRAYYQGVWQDSGKLLAKWPLDLGIWADRVEGMLGLPELSAAEVQATVDGWQKAAEKNKETPSFNAFVLRLIAPIADEYLRRNIRLAQIQPMIEAGFKASDDVFQRLMQYDSVPPQVRANQIVNSRFAYWSGWAVLARYYAQQGQPQKARETLEKLNADLAQHKPAETVPAFVKNNYAGFQALYLEARGSLAEAENRKLDALIHYQNAITALPKEIVSQFISKAHVDMLNERAEKLWKELGGTSEGKTGWELRKPTP